jgi:energy-coupling factor transporter ATP-binding protein EcfA2
MTSFRVRSLTSSGGDVVELMGGGVTCIVGGNNVGKSQLLREIAQRAGDPVQTGPVLRDLTVLKADMDLPAAEDFLARSAVRQKTQPGDPPQYSPHGGGTILQAGPFLSFYQGPDHFVHVRGFFLRHLSAGSLVGIASQPAPSGDAGAQNEISAFFRDGEMEQELSDLARSTFGVPLTLDRVNGDIRFRVNEVDMPIPALNRPTRAYADAVQRLDSLEDQGDGMKSFLGLAVTVLTASAQVLLIDEPEAFLHPPQARALGRWLGKKAKALNLQIIISTHDRDLLLGLMESESLASLNLLRLTRVGDLNYLRQLPPEKVKAVWTDPVLRYSNVLQGLFHGRVVICEADADCRFYGAAIDALAIEREVRMKSDDILLVPSGGKQRVGTMAAALARLGVEVWAIVDFDVFRKRDDLRRIVEGVGATWTPEMDADYVAFADVANQKSLWDSLKHVGLEGTPRGPAYEAIERLLSSLRTVSVLVVRVGEMEDYDKSVNLHGAAWVSAMLEKKGHSTSTSVRDLIDPLLK